MTPLNSVRNRLVLLFFAITTAAVGFVYLYVVPQLRSSLTAERLTRLEGAAAHAQSTRVRAAMLRGPSQPKVRRMVRDIARRTDSRTTLLGLEQSAAGAVPAFVISDSARERTAVAPGTRPRRRRRSTGTVELLGGAPRGHGAGLLGDRGGDGRTAAVGAGR